MKNFFKNYLLLILMGVGFVVVIGGTLILPRQASQQNTESTATSVKEEYAVSADSFNKGKLEPLSIERMDGTIEQFMVEVALTDEEQRYGLMERQVMPNNQGMLFVFKESAPKSFWMKNVLIPLDLLYIDEEGYIHHIHPMTLPGSEQPLASNGPIRYALELVGGITEKLNIDVGDKVISRLIETKAP